MVLARLRSAYARLRPALKPAIAFDLWTTLLFAILLVPVAGWLMRRVLASGGQYAVSDHDLAALRHVIFAGEFPGGLVDSVTALQTSLAAGGVDAVIVPDLTGIGGTPASIWAVLGTYPDNHVLSFSEGQNEHLCLQTVWKLLRHYLPH